MASITGSVKGSGSVAPVVQEPALELADTMQALFRDKVWKDLVSVPVVQRTGAQPKPFQGTCAECVATIEGTVHGTIERMDFDGLKPFVKVIDLIEGGEIPEEWVFDAENDGVGGICVGMSLEHLKNMRNEHGIEGALAVEKDEVGEYHHAAVIVECEDGLVFIDNRAIPENRLFPIPFGSTYEGKGFTIAVPLRGISPPLVLSNPERRFEYYTDIANGVDVVNKQFMPFSFNSIIPIAVYRQDGETFKDIIVQPGKKRVRLKNYATGETRYVPFEEIRKGGGVEGLGAFMGSDFHTSEAQANGEIVKFVTHADKMRKLFS